MLVGNSESTSVGCVEPVAKRTKPLSGRPLALLLQLDTSAPVSWSCPVVTVLHTPTITPVRLSKTQTHRTAGTGRLEAALAVAQVPGLYGDARVAARGGMAGGRRRAPSSGCRTAPGRPRR